MPLRYAFWTAHAEAKTAEHGVDKEEGEHVLNHALEDEPSRSNPGT